MVSSVSRVLSWLPGLKGAPLSVVVSLLICGPLLAGELEAATGYSHGTITRALRLLKGLGLVAVPVRGQGYVLNRVGAVQLGFEFRRLDGVVDKSADSVDNMGISGGKNVALSSQYRESTGASANNEESRQYDHDDDHIRRRILELRHVFEGAAKWVKENNTALILAWISYIEHDADRDKLTNEAGFLRAMVRRGDYPEIRADVEGSEKQRLDRHLGKYADLIVR